MAAENVLTAEMHQSVRNSIDAYDRYEDFVSENLCKLSYRIDRDADFGIDSKVHCANAFMVGRFTTTAGRGELIRTKSDINRDPRGRYALYIPIRGEQELSQFSRTQKCGSGSMTMLSTHEPFVQRKCGDNDTIYFFMPREFVDQRLARAENLCARPIPVGAGVTRLVYDSIVSLQRDATSMSALEFDSAARIVGELVLLGFGATADMSFNVSSVRSGNLARAKRLIRARLADPNFTIADAAKGCGISVRYLHDLFHSDGITASEYLKQQRLQRARQMLENATTGTTVTTVCFSCGFSNASQFSTAFRKTFSISPRDVLHRGGCWGA